MAVTLASQNIVRVKPPVHYSKKFKDHLIAGPLAVNLREKSPFFYEAGLKLVRALDDADMRLILSETYSGERFKQILDWSVNSVNEDITHFTKNLSHSELRLFDSGFLASVAVQRWKSGQAKRTHYDAQDAKRRRTA